MVDSRRQDDTALQGQRAAPHAMAAACHAQAPSAGMPRGENDKPHTGSDPRRQYGRDGERLAEKYLKRRGLKLIARGYTTPVGEIDLILRDRETIVFVEVKTRRSRAFADPQDSVGAAKQRKMRRCAEWFLRERNWTDRPCRFDVVGIVLAQHGQPEIEHLPDAFQPRY